MNLSTGEGSRIASASSWGCELKWHQQSIICQNSLRQPLREAVSWNSRKWGNKHERNCQPLREAVSWNVIGVIASLTNSRQPLREAVSWNDFKRRHLTFKFCQPLREAVSWNTNSYPGARSAFLVSLFVRLWVEISCAYASENNVVSQPLREAVSWNCFLPS